jgi:hypothetical protein
MYEIEFEFDGAKSGEFRLSDNVIQTITGCLKKIRSNKRLPCSLRPIRRWGISS